MVNKSDLPRRIGLNEEESANRNNLKVLDSWGYSGLGLHLCVVF